MSERIYQAIDSEFQRRMRNWARSRAGLLKGLGIAFTSAYTGFRYDRSPEAGLPTLMGDAEDVNDCLVKLPARYRQAVELFWDHEGQSLRRLAKQCRPLARAGARDDEVALTRLAIMTGKRGVNYETFEAWVMRGHELLAPLMVQHRSRAMAHNAALRGAGAGGMR